MDQRATGKFQINAKNLDGQQIIDDFDIFDVKESGRADAFAAAHGVFNPASGRSMR
jgi:hypothetical protein